MKTVIFGTSNFSQMMYWYLSQDASEKVAGFCVEDAFFSDQMLDGLPVVPYSKVKKEFPPDEFQVLLAMGTTQMGDVRERLFNSFKKDGYVLRNYIHPSALLQGCRLGEGNIILERVLVQPFSSIGNGNLIWYQSSIAHNNKIGDFNTIAGGASLSGFVQIENHCFVGNNATVRDHVCIASYTLVGAGCYVDRDTEAHGVYVPTRSLRLERDSREFRV